MESGTVTAWFEDRGFGFIRPDEGGVPIFLHMRALSGDPPEKGSRIYFEVEQGERGPRARRADIA